MGESILEFVDVSLRANVGMGLLLDGVSFKVAPQSCVAVVGPSGAGKTSLLRLINRLSDPTKGIIYYDQRPLSSYPVVKLRQQIGLVMQEPRLLGQGVEEALGYPDRLKGLDATTTRQRLQPWLERLKIPRDWLPRRSVELSVGQRQRVAIARTLATEPNLLLLDEPTAAQDLGYAQHLLNHLANPAQPTTVIMVNHQLELMADWATHVLHLQQGQIISYQTVEKTDWQALKQTIIQTQQDDTWADDWED